MNCTVCIVEDNAADAAYFSAMVRDWAAAAGITVRISTFPSAEAFLFWYEEAPALDILLLDVEMGPMNGMQLAKQLRDCQETAQLVFVTGYPDFIGEGYEVGALHYLLKPVSPQKLAQVLGRAVDSLARQEKRLCVSFDRQTRFVPINDILYLEAQKQYVLVHAVGETLRTKASLSEMLPQLDEYFLQCQRSFIVNLWQVQQVNSDCLLLKNGERVPISRGMARTVCREITRLF